MLKNVNFPILLPRFDGSYEHIDLKNLVMTNHPSSRGGARLHQCAMVRQLYKATIPIHKGKTQRN